VEALRATAGSGPTSGRRQLQQNAAAVHSLLSCCRVLLAQSLMRLKVTSDICSSIGRRRRHSLLQSSTTYEIRMPTTTVPRTRSPTCTRSAVAPWNSAEV
jgi:hypothetical protein